MLSIWQVLHTVNPGNAHTKVMTNGGSKRINEVFHHCCVIFTHSSHCIAAVILASY